MSSDAANVRDSLKLLETLTRDAESVMRTIIVGHPDHPKYGTVMADRTLLSIKLRRSFGQRTDYTEIERLLALYGPTLRYADVNFGTVPTEPNIQAMRDAEGHLHRGIIAVAKRCWYWRLFGHERSS